MAYLASNDLRIFGDNDRLVVATGMMGNFLLHNAVVSRVNWTLHPRMVDVTCMGSERASYMVSQDVTLDISLVAQEMSVLDEVPPELLSPDDLTVRQLLSCVHRKLKGR